MPNKVPKPNLGGDSTFLCHCPLNRNVLSFVATRTHLPPKLGFLLGISDKIDWGSCKFTRWSSCASALVSIWVEDFLNLPIKG